MVKADAYGLGAAKAAPALMRAGCRNFFVAHFHEGAALRGLLADRRIYVLEGMSGRAPAEFAEAGLIPVLNSLAEIQAWTAFLDVAGPRPSAAHIDTGMSRLGLTPKETAAFLDAPGAFATLDDLLILSHLACADEPDHPLNDAQRRDFAAIRARLPNARASLANSSGLFLGDGFHFDLGRPGSALYGINPTPGRANPMRQVARLTAQILQIRDVPPGASVGYGGAFVASSSMRVATLGIGYADGYRRSLGGKTQALAGGRLVPTIGRVSMDLTAIDVSDLPDLAPGDIVELMGDAITPDDLAELAGTIGYEILTSLGPRLRRVYVGDAT